MATCAIPKIDRDAIVREVRSLTASWVGQDRLLREGRGDSIGGTCLYVSAAVVYVLRHRGVQAIIQAGSMSWPKVNRDQDDGVINTHFTYLWDAGSPEAQQALAGASKPAAVNGCRRFALPEMHCWAAIPHTQEIIDLSTHDFPALAKLCGEDWPGDQPPDYLWCPAAKLPARVYYWPDFTATMLALRLIQRSYLR